MHPAQIQAALKMADQPTLQADVARQCDVVPTVVHDVIHGNRRSRKVELRIASITRLPLAELWPQWYGAHAKLRRRSNQAHAASALSAAAR
ncbi:MAG: helix-turn-helix domain-containing protein [Dyella sp.]|uniref:helix-turn-helix domain-containing protein n=1 Tax=Dyella sp. TaxID=1869338 RepID=UPI003F8090A0